MAGCESSMHFNVKRIGGPKRQPPLQVFLELQGDSRSLRLIDLKYLIAKKSGVPFWAQRLFYKTRYLRGLERSFGDLEVPSGASLLLATSAHYDDPPSVEPEVVVASGVDLRAGGTTRATSSQVMPDAADIGATVEVMDETAEERLLRLARAAASATAPSWSAEVVSPQPAPAVPATGGASEPPIQPGGPSVDEATASEMPGQESSRRPADPYQQMSVAELRALLTLRKVDISSCVEKTDLVDLARRTHSVVVGGGSGGAAPSHAAGLSAAPPQPQPDAATAHTFIHLGPAGVGGPQAPGGESWSAAGDIVSSLFHQLGPIMAGHTVVHQVHQTVPQGGHYPGAAGGAAPFPPPPPPFGMPPPGMHSQEFTFPFISTQNFSFPFPHPPDAQGMMGMAPPSTQPATTERRDDTGQPPAR